MNIITELLTSELAKDQNKVYSVDVYGVTLINLDKFYEEAFYITNHTAYSYCIPFDFKNKDIKKIFYNAFIFSVCEYIKVNKNKIVFYYDRTTQNKHFTFIVNKCKTLLPIHIYIDTATFEDIVKFISEGDVDICSNLEKIASQTLKFKYQNFTFRKLNNFLKRNELIFLKEAYFTQHQTKLTLLT